MQFEFGQMNPGQIRSRLDDILPHVSKPARYFAGEIGTVTKDWETGRVRMVIGFPDVYEIAAVNLGHQLIKQIVNSVDGQLCERVYSPWPDMEAKLRESGTPLYSLDSYHPVFDFDIFGVSMTHELAYTNLLQMIDLSGLELRAKDRGFPIVIAGGPSVFNPEPIADFVDAFILGDGEDVVGDLMAVVADYREDIDKARGNPDREREIKDLILDKWGGAGGKTPIQGVYVPSHFKIHEKPDGGIESIENIKGGPSIIHKALVTDLDTTPWVKNLPIPHMQKISSRITIEPIRGCTHGCRFCQAGMTYRPYRERSIDLLVEQAEGLLESTGLQEQSFLALSATDWPDLVEFIRRMKGRERPYHLKVSLPSNRIAALNRELTDLIISNRKGGLTLAIEAASLRLRAVINKEVTDEDIVNAVTNALSSGWDLIKLYFMIGLPTETDDDVEEIVELVGRIRGLARQLKRDGKTNVRNMKIKVSVSNFVPKSYTPFQWVSMETPESLDRRQKLLVGLRRIKGVEYSSHDIDASILEGVLARGDRKLADVIEGAFRNGARFDAWNDQHDPAAWEKGFSEAGIDQLSYLEGRDVDEILPWEHLSCGVDKEWLKKDMLRSLEGTMLPDCNESSCHSCGMHSIYAECRPLRTEK